MMQKILFLLFCSLFFQKAEAQLFLSEGIAVSEEGTGARAPRIALLENDNPVVYWGKQGSNPKLYIAQLDGGSFGESLLINTNGVEPDLWGGGLGPQIVADGNTVFLVFENYGQGVYCIKSNDGGITFDNPVEVFIAPTGRVATLPAITIDLMGNPIISFVTTNFSEQDAQYEVAKSLDGGLTFELPTVANTAASGAEVCECCPASMGVAAGDEVFLAFRNNDNDLRDIWVAKSSDTGASFTEATDIDETDWQIQSCPQSGPDMMVSGDNLSAVFFNGADGAKIYFSSVNKNTMELESHFHITPVVENKNQNFPSVAGSGDTLAVIWQESGQFGLDIMMAWTTTGPADLLNNKIVVADDILSERQPDMLYKNGEFHIVYEDSNSGQVMYRIASFDPSVPTVEPIVETYAVRIQPNPFLDKTTITFDNPNSEVVDVFVINTNGQIIQQHKTTNTFSTITDLERGIYLLKVQKGNAVVVENLVVQ